jgi:hypothetical protein
LFFKVISQTEEVEVIAVGTAIRELSRLRKLYGKGRWRKLKGNALIEFDDGTVVRAELHWYEAHGYDKKEIKLKRVLEN